MTDLQILLFMVGIALAVVTMFGVAVLVFCWLSDRKKEQEYKRSIAERDAILSVTDAPDLYLLPDFRRRFMDPPRSQDHPRQPNP